jgi:non-canonical (house-cleaning) NTP pyrophosphatase
VGTSARFEVRGEVLERLQDGEEMSTVMDEVTGDTDIGNKGGMMGAITNGHLPRSPCYEHGLFFAFAPFVSDKMFWE